MDGGLGGGDGGNGEWTTDWVELECVTHEEERKLGGCSGRTCAVGSHIQSTVSRALRTS